MIRQELGCQACHHIFLDKRLGMRLVVSVFASILRKTSLIVLALSLAACGTSSKNVPEGQYRVAKGDTLTQIARKHGQSLSSLMRMNNIQNPNRIHVGQILRVQGSGSVAQTGVQGSAPLPDAGSGAAQAHAPAKASSVAAPRSIGLVWPANGSARRGTTTATTQGVYITAARGSSVRAAAAGEVAYAGDGLRGYGNMLLIRHDANFLSIYAHNERLLVKQGARVTQGQQIATVGNTGTNAVQLYFELRYNGKPVDALRYLPRK